MKKNWFNGLEEKQKEEMKQAFNSCSLVRSKLKEMCETKIQGSYTTSKDQYDSPNWIYQKADDIGYRRALEEIISLIS